MVSKSKTVPSNRFSKPAEPTVRLGSETNPPDLYFVSNDKYGKHYRRVLADGQYIDYSIIPCGMLVEKVNFVPSKERRDGNGAYGNRWLGICEYRQSEDYASDLEFFAANGMKLQPDATSGRKTATLTPVNR